MTEWLLAMNTDETPANPYKVISMLRRKIKRRPDRRIRKLAYNLKVALRRRNLEIDRLRRDYGELERAFMRQHLRDVIEIERLKKKMVELLEEATREFPDMDGDIYWNGPRAIKTGRYDDYLFHEDLAKWFEKWFGV